jgi:hypothetical protein
MEVTRNGRQRPSGCGAAGHAGPLAHYVIENDKPIVTWL